jgi:hypothetical protein
VGRNREPGSRRNPGVIQSEAMTKKETEAWKRGIQQAAELASEYDGVSSHPFRLEDCILAKLNMKPTKRMRANRFAVPCRVREHAGLERVMAKIGMNEPLLPDPDLGQDVAFLAFVIERMKAVVDAARDYAKLFNMKSCNVYETRDTFRGLQIKRRMAKTLEALDENKAFDKR